MTNQAVEHPATPVTWSLALPGIGDQVLAAIALLAAAPRPVWIWAVLVQPAIALGAVPRGGSLALAVFAAVSIAPVAIAWWVAIRQRRLRYTVSPTRGTLHVRTLGTDSSDGDDAEPVVVGLDDVDEIAAVPLRGRIAVRFRRDRAGDTAATSVPRIVLVPADRWPGVAAACLRADVSLPWGGPGNERPSLGVIARIALSAIVPAAGVAVGVGLGFWWLL